MFNMSFLACTKVELWDLKVCIAANGEKFQSHSVTLTLVRQCPISNFSYTKNVFKFHVPRSIFFSYHGKIHMETHTHTDARKDFDKYSNATIIRLYFTFSLNAW